MPKNLTAFYRDFVAQSKPCIITNAFNTWPALELWDIGYLNKKAGHLDISADLTPSGHGDCVAPAPGYSPDEHYATPDSVPVGGVYDPAVCFVKPLQARIKFGHFLEELQKHENKLLAGDETALDDEVYYLQHQNDSFRKEFVGVLGEDLDKSIEEFGNELFGCPPDAINLWAGDSRAVSSMHKDHYENLYCVIRGTKCFTLLPPTDLPWLGQKWFREANYERNEEGKLVPKLQEPENAIPWIPIDPDWSEEERREKLERAALISPLHVEVHEGEMLYLPALVYHKVSQIGDEEEGKVIAINYWWDMQFGAAYTHYKLLEAMVAQRDTKEQNAAQKKGPKDAQKPESISSASSAPASAAPALSAATDTSTATQSREEANIEMSDTVFVGNLTFNATEEDLSMYFGQFGEVSSVKYPLVNGRPRGFAFVKFSKMESASMAAKMNGDNFQGRSLRICLAQNPN